MLVKNVYSNNSVRMQPFQLTNFIQPCQSAITLNIYSIFFISQKKRLSFAANKFQRIPHSAPHSILITRQYFPQAFWCLFFSPGAKSHSIHKLTHTHTQTSHIVVIQCWQSARVCVHTPAIANSSRKDENIILRAIR